jgi:hypothetical protein
MANVLVIVLALFTLFAVVAVDINYPSAYYNYLISRDRTITVQSHLPNRIVPRCYAVLSLKY